MPSRKIAFPAFASPKFRQVQQKLYLIKDKSGLCPIQLQIALAPKKTAHDMANVKNVYHITKQRMSGHTAPGNLYD